MNTPARTLPVFAGREHLIQRLDAALAGAHGPLLPARVEAVLKDCITDPAIVLPAAVWEDPGPRYARRLLGHSERHGYSVIAMTWGPGQSTPLHDHDDQWCVEAVWRGPLEVVPCDLLDEVDGICHFLPGKPQPLSAGDSGHLQPPDQYHIIRNPSADTVAVSVHVYQSLMTRCRIFLPDGRGAHTSAERQLDLHPWP